MDSPAARYCAKVKIVVADSDRQLSEGLRAALVAEGYRDIRTTGWLSAVRDVIAEEMVDLLVLDVDLPDGDAVALVRDIRRGKVGRNPFLSVIFVTWESDAEVIRRAVNSGVDLILIKPLSAARLFSRINRLVADRKRFVTTADYIGPDRRSGDASPGQHSYDVPNTLKDKIEGRPVDPAALSDQIKSALKAMNSRRLEQAALQLLSNIDAICRSFTAGPRDDEVEYALAQANYIAREIANLGTAEIAKLCTSLKNVIDTIRVDPIAAGAKQFELLKPIAMSILLACKPGLASHEVVQEISQVLERPRAEAQPTDAPSDVTVCDDAA